jgi:hypothetical protein
MPPRAPSLALLAALLGGALLAGCTAPEEAAPAAPAPRVPDEEPSPARAQAGAPARATSSGEADAAGDDARGDGGPDPSNGLPLEDREGESPMRLFVTADAAPAEPCRREPVNVTVAVEDATGAPIEGAAVNATWRTGALGARVANATDATGIANLTRAAPARTDALIPIEVEATEGRRYGAAVTFVTVADCGTPDAGLVQTWLDEPWAAGELPLPEEGRLP